MPDGEKLPCQGQTGRGEGCGSEMCDLSGPRWAPGCRPLGGQGVWRDLGLFQQSLPIAGPGCVSRASHTAAASGGEVAGVDEAEYMGRWEI